MDIQPSDRILDIGFGGGITIEEMLKVIDTGKIYGIDFSEVMVKQARDRFKEAIESNKVSIVCANVEKLPFDDSTFDKICTVNTIYFWADIVGSLAEIRRVLKNDGRLVVGIRSADKMKDLPFTQHNFKLYSPEEVRDILTDAGFTNISIEHRDRDDKFDSVMITALR
jgi:ubiquinone/menaquinone biosynthesis C-methylase UbiE